MERGKSRVSQRQRIFVLDSYIVQSQYCSISIKGLSEPSFFPTKKKLAPTIQGEGLMIPAASQSQM